MRAAIPAANCSDVMFKDNNSGALQSGLLKYMPGSYILPSTNFSSGLVVLRWRSYKVGYQWF